VPSFAGRKFVEMPQFFSIAGEGAMTDVEALDRILTRLVLMGDETVASSLQTMLPRTLQEIGEEDNAQRRKVREGACVRSGGCAFGCGGESGGGATCS
jgi:hypothetical protein